MRCMASSSGMHLALTDVDAEEAREGAKAARMRAVERAVGAQIRVRPAHDALDVRLRPCSCRSRSASSVPWTSRIASDSRMRSMSVVIESVPRSFEISATVLPAYAGFGS